MANNVGRCATRGQWRGRPKLSGLLVSNIESLARGVLNRIVAPGRQSKLMGVLHPCVSRAALGNNRSEPGIGQHIDPRRRRHLAGLKSNDIFMAVPAEPAQAVGKNQIARRKRSSRVREPAMRGCQGRNQRLQYAAMRQLFLQASLLIVQNNSRRGLQQHAVIVGNLFEAPDEDAARFVQHLRLNAGGNQICDLILQGLAVNRDILVQDDQINRESLHAPIRVRLNQLPDDLDFLRVADAEQDDRRVARNAVAPEAVLSAPVVEQDAGVGAAGGVGINQSAGQPAVELGIALRDVEMVQRHLAVSPRQIKGAVGHARTLIFFRERQGGFPAFGHACHQINDGRFMGRQGDGAPQRNNGIQHGTDRVGQGRNALNRGGVGQGSAASDKF